MACDIHKRMVRYLLRFNTQSDTTLAVKAFREQEKESNGKFWLNQTKNFLNMIGMNMVHKKMKEMNNNDSDHKKISKMTHHREKEIFEQNVLHEIDSKMKKSEGKLLF